MFFILLMMRSSSFKITCGLTLLRWSNFFFAIFENLWSTLGSQYAYHYAWLLFSVFAGRGTWELYSSCFWIWCKSRNPFFNDNVWRRPLLVQACSSWWRKLVLHSIYQGSILPRGHRSSAGLSCYWKASVRLQNSIPNIQM